MRWRKRVKRWIVWTVARSLDRLINVLPRSAAIKLGGLIGLLAWSVLPKDRAMIARNLKMTFKDSLSERERSAIGRRFFVNSGKNLMDIVRFKKHYARDIKPLVTVEGLEHFDTAYRAGRGLVGITGHLGNFELLAAHMASLGYEVAVIGRELSDPRLDGWLISNRQAAGLTNIATTESPRRILSWLKSGKALGVLVDTDSMRVRGIEVPFFGLPAKTPVAPFQLGLRAGSAFIPLCCVRRPDDTYLLRIAPPVFPAAGLSEDDAIMAVSTMCNKVLEEFVRTWPDQWIWLHNRWHVDTADVS